MRKLYTKAFILFWLCAFPKIVFSQCEDITVDSITNPGPYDIATLDESDGIRNGPDYDGATIYYPTNAAPPFVSIAMVTGFLSDPEDIEEWGPFYASHGIVVINIGTNSGGDLPDARAAGLLDALETLRQENLRSGSPLEGSIDDNKFAVSGWSMGGGGAQRAAVLDPSIKAVVALCPWLDFTANLNHSAPVLIFSGQNDTVAPPAIHATLHYANTPNETQKVLFEIENAPHDVANTPDGADGVIGKMALSWLKLYVDENACYCDLLNDSLLTDPVASMMQTNIDAECAVLSIDEVTITDISLYPNPTNSIITFRITQNTPYQIYSVAGVLISEGNLHTNDNQIDISELPANTYFVKTATDVFKVIKTD